MILFSDTNHSLDITVSRFYGCWVKLFKGNKNGKDRSQHDSNDTIAVKYAKQSKTTAMVLNLKLSNASIALMLKKVKFSNATIALMLIKIIQY